METLNFVKWRVQKISLDDNLTKAVPKTMKEMTKFV